MDDVERGMEKIESYWRQVVERLQESLANQERVVQVVREVNVVDHVCMVLSCHVTPQGTFIRVIKGKDDEK